VAKRLVSIIDQQNLDGIDLDYEYCYDIAGKQAGKCPQRSALYSDAKAQTFLNSITYKLREELDELQSQNGYNRGRYEITHAPMDSDLDPSTSAYFQILKKRSADLDFLMPQFYNGVTRAHVDGIEGSGVGALSAASMFKSLSNDMFDSEPEKVVFGFCISDCKTTGSNVNEYQAVEIMSDLKAINGGEFGCNGGAFFWVAMHDEGGAWSDAVVGEVRKTAGCSTGATTSSTTTVSSELVTSSTSLSTTTSGVSTSGTLSSSTQPVTTASTTTSNSGGNLVEDTQSRCGKSELDARENCKQVCVSNSDCVDEEFCWGVHANYCGSILKRTYTDPVLSNVFNRCGASEIEARTFCGAPCSWSDPPCRDGQKCQYVHPNYCGSNYLEDGSTTSSVATTTSSAATTSFGGALVVDTQRRCGASESKARSGCAKVCDSQGDCGSGEWCWEVHPNYCGSLPDKIYDGTPELDSTPRCGTSELDARGLCKNTCVSDADCDRTIGEMCLGVNENYCDSPTL